MHPTEPKFISQSCIVKEVTTQVSPIMKRAKTCVGGKPLPKERRRSDYSQVFRFIAKRSNRAIVRYEPHLKSSSPSYGRVSMIQVRRNKKMGTDGLFFYHPNLLCCLDQMLAVIELSQHLVSSSKTVRSIIS